MQSCIHTGLGSLLNPSWRRNPQGPNLWPHYLPECDLNSCSLEKARPRAWSVGKWSWHDDGGRILSPNRQVLNNEGSPRAFRLPGLIPRERIGDGRRDLDSPPSGVLFMSRGPTPSGAGIPSRVEGLTDPLLGGHITAKGANGFNTTRTSGLDRTAPKQKEQENV
jgi:hypothetical protein